MKTSTEANTVVISGFDKWVLEPQDFVRRRDEMRRLRFVEHMTCQAIGDRYGLSRERVRQIIGNTAEAFRRVRGNWRAEVIAKHPELTNDEITQQFGVPSGAVVALRAGTRHAISGAGCAGMGHRIEEIVSARLTSLGIVNRLMPCLHPHDIELPNGTRIDVKSTSALRCATRKSLVRNFFLRIESRGHYADFFILVLRDTMDMFVVPYAVAPKNATPVRFVFPRLSNQGGKSKWLQYHNRFDLLQRKKG